jgi:FkbM family methyltransferase
MLGQLLKHLVVRTPLEAVALGVRDAFSQVRCITHPELSAIHQEGRYVAEACQMILTPRSNTIDIGAHLGIQLSALLNFASEGRHIAFEPVPHKARWLRRKFPEVDVREVALHHTPGEVTFYVNRSRPGYSGLRLHRNPEHDVEPITVQQRSLDECLSATHEVDFIKVDVEGGELFVLQGALDLLSRCRPTILFESTHSGHEAWGVQPEQLFDFLAAQRYAIYLPRSFVCGGAALSRAEFI